MYQCVTTPLTFGWHPTTGDREKEEVYRARAVTCRYIDERKRRSEELESPIESRRRDARRLYKEYIETLKKAGYWEEVERCQKRLKETEIESEQGEK